MDFERVYQELFTPLYRYVVIRVRNDDEALDIVQEVFTRAYQQYPEKSSDELGRILYQSARNAIIDRSRKKRPVELDSFPGAAELIADDSQNAERSTERAWERVLVRELVEALSETDREIIALRYFQELPYPEIASRLNLSEAAVRKRHSRSMSALSKQLHEWYESHETSHN